MRVLSSAKGKTVSAITGLLHLSNGHLDIENPLAITLLFEDHSVVTFKCGSDGETLMVSSERSEAVDMVEWGHSVIADISSSKPWLGVLGKKLDNAHVVATDQVVAGFELLFGLSTPVVILNLGDEILQFSQLPASLVEQEGFRRIHIT